MVSGALSGGCGRAFVRGERFGRLKDATRVRFNSHIGEGALCFWYREQQTGWGKRDRAVIVNSGESGDQLVCDRSVASAHEGSLGIASVLEPARRSKKWWQRVVCWARRGSAVRCSWASVGTDRLCA